MTPWNIVLKSSKSKLIGLKTKESNFRWCIDHIVLYEVQITDHTVPGKCKLTLDPRSSRASGIADRVSILDSIDSKLNSILDAGSSKNLSVWNFVDYAYSMRLSRKRLIPRRQNNSRETIARDCAPMLTFCQRRRKKIRKENQRILL